MRGKLTAVLLVALGLGGVFVASGCGSSGGACTIGSANCACTAGGACDPGLSCVANKCVGGSGTGGTAGTDAGTDASTSMDPDTVCAGISAVCTKFNECAPLYVQLAYGSMEGCVTRFKLSCKDAVSAPGSTINVAAVAACASALPSATCEAVLYNQVDACNFKGKRTNGEACGTDAQCTTGHCTLGDSACGVCANQVGAGNSCTDNGDCSSGFVCSDDQHCVLPGAGGTVCTDVQPCKYGFYCRNGSCVTAANSAGATCQDQASSCVFLKGLWCNVSVQTCAAVSYAQPGEPCGQVGSRYAVCSAGSCIYPLGSTEGTCASLGGDGDACGTGTANDKGCQFPSRCVAGHCKKPNSAACQ